MIAFDIAPLVGSAFLLGAFGSVHCLGMCGGIAGALGQATPLPTSTTPRKPRKTRTAFAVLPRLSLYSLGRITSYAVAGSLAGLLGEVVTDLAGLTVLLRSLTGLLIITCGLHLLGVFNGLSAIEGFGMRVWSQLAPATSRIGRPDRPWKIFAFGLLWGWLPCGLVYTALVAAAATSSALSGAAFMLAFGLGTMPALLTASGFGASLGRFLALRSARRAAGVLMIVFGFIALLGAAMPLVHEATSHSSHAPHPYPPHHATHE